MPAAGAALRDREKTGKAGRIDTADKTGKNDKRDR